MQPFIARVLASARHSRAGRIHRVKSGLNLYGPHRSARGSLRLSLFQSAYGILDVGNCLIDLLLPAMRLGDDTGDRAAMPGDDDGLAALDLVEQPGKVRFDFGRFNFECHQ